MTRLTTSVILPDRLRKLTAELCRPAPESDDQLARAKMEHEFLEVVCKLFNLITVLTPDHYLLLRSDGIPKYIGAFISSNLQRIDSQTVANIAAAFGFRLLSNSQLDPSFDNMKW